MIKERQRLASVEYDQHLLVERLRLHFIEDLGEVFAVDNLSVLDLEKVLPAMAIHVYEHPLSLI